MHVTANLEQAQVYCAVLCYPYGVAFGAVLCGINSLAAG